MTVTITDLVVNFRDGLRGLLPSVERVGIRWRRPEAYDEWDHLVTSVFEALVVEPIRSGLSGSGRAHFSLAKYDMLLPTYTGLVVIEVLPPHPEQHLRVFHALGTSREAFDMVEWRPVKVDGTPLSDELRIVPLESARFRVRVPLGDSRVAVFDEVVVP